jgi:hypothetical protein
MSTGPPELFAVALLGMTLMTSFVPSPPASLNSEVFAATGSHWPPVCDHWKLSKLEGLARRHEP